MKLPMEVEQNKTPPFLDIVVSRISDSLLAYAVYRHLTQMDHYLHATSEHHPSQKCANTICEEYRLTWKSAIRKEYSYVMDTAVLRPCMHLPQNKD
jgi:hypothetical protein